MRLNGAFLRTCINNVEGKKRAAVHGRSVEGMLEQEVTKGKDTASQGPGPGGPTAGDQFHSEKSKLN